MQETVGVHCINGLLLNCLELPRDFLDLKGFCDDVLSFQVLPSKSVSTFSGRTISVGKSIRTSFTKHIFIPGNA